MAAWPASNGRAGGLLRAIMGSAFGLVDRRWRVCDAVQTRTPCQPGAAALV